MKARVPGMQQGGMQSMLRQAQKMQEDMQNIQAELEQQEYTSTSGGGMVSATVSGKYEVKKLEINPDVVDSDDVEMLEDLVCAAVNAAIALAKADSDEKLGAVTGGMNIPGMF